MPTATLLSSSNVVVGDNQTSRTNSNAFSIKIVDEDVVGGGTTAVAVVARPLLLLRLAWPGCRLASSIRCCRAGCVCCGLSSLDALATLSPRRCILSRGILFGTNTSKLSSVVVEQLKRLRHFPNGVEKFQNRVVLKKYMT